MVLFSTFRRDVRAQETRTGGRYIAQQRGSEKEVEAPTVMLPPIPRGMLIERLGAASLALVADMLGCGVDELERRYSA